jgi:ABC-2 type transport system permease protein
MTLLTRVGLLKLSRVELLKLRTTRVTYGLLLTVAALTALFASLEASRAGNRASGVASLATASGISTVTTLTGWSMLFAAVLGVIASSGEFRHSTATLTYLGTPRRERVLAAKALSSALVGAVFGLTAAAFSTAVGLGFVAAHGYRISISTGDLISHGAGAILGAALLAAIGVGLGSLIRSQIAGIVVVFIWGLVIESVIGGLFTSVRPYLPYTAATTLAGIKLGGAAFGPAHGVNGGAPLPFIAATGLVAGTALILGFVAARISVPKDVT